MNHIKENKKSQQMVIMLIILASIGMIVFFFFTGTAIAGLSDIDLREACKVSVITKAEKNLVVESKKSLECYTNYIDITEKGIYFLNEKKRRKLDVKFKDKTQEERINMTKKYLADQHYYCWYQYGEGAVDFLGDVDVPSPKRCFPCARIHFEEGFLDGFTSKDWYNYLDDNNIPNGQISYFKYLKYDFDIENNVDMNKIINTKAGDYMNIYLLAYKKGFVETHTTDGSNFFAEVKFTNFDEMSENCDSLY